MILEVADIRIRAGEQIAFDEAIARGLDSVISKAECHLSHQVVRGIESPERYLLMIRWATLESHTIGFRDGPLFPQWRAIVGPFFAQPPVVEHFELSSASA